MAYQAASVGNRAVLAYIYRARYHFYYFLSAEYMRSLNWFKYHIWPDPLVYKTFGKKGWIFQSQSTHLQLSSPPKDYIPNHLSDSSDIEGYLFIIFFIMFIISPFCRFTRLVWRIYHRKTIKEMGSELEWEWFDNIIVYR